ncbi:MAG: NAD-binding protein [Desulfotignum sp.]|nr:NAD-binding protein [Desulfotignum sp.]MCF8138574.1 NAD-binding protein [Desulfotignum sp.]
MKLIICGAGRITDELLKRAGANWEIILIEKDAAKLAPFSTRFPNIVRVMSEDASSPVVLDKAGLSNQDGILAMTNDDAVNLAIVRFAKQADIKTVLAVVRDPEQLPAFQKLGVWTISMAADAARKAYQFVKDPRIRIIDLGEGEGELLELAVGKQELARLEDIAATAESNPHWRIAGIIRNNQLLFPDQQPGLKQEDRLLILGKDDLYNAFSQHLEGSRLHFPRTYGQHMVLGLANSPSLDDTTELINEAVYLAQGTHIEKIAAICGNSESDIHEALSRWSESLEIEIIETSQASVENAAVHTAAGKDAGIVVLPAKNQSFLRTVFKGGISALAARLPCPLLSARMTDPYEHLMVPFNGSLACQRALEITMDLALQLEAEVSVIIVAEPSYLKGKPSGPDPWEQQMVQQVRDLARVHDTQVQEIVRRGNPVKEIAAAAADCQLLVLAGNDGHTGFFSIQTADMILNRVSCSVLLVS